MPYGATGEGEVCISEDRDDPHTVDTIDMGNDLFKELAGVFPPCTLLLTRCRVRSQFSSMKAWYRTVKRGTCHALTVGGDG